MTRFIHFVSRCYFHGFNQRMIGTKMCGSAHQNDFSTKTGSGKSDIVPHLPRGMVSNETHGIDRFVCWACGNEDFLSVKRHLLFVMCLEETDNILGFSHPALACESAGKFAGFSGNHDVSELLQCFKTLLRRWMTVHIEIHRRREKHWAFC